MSACPGYGLANYNGLCPVCRLEPYFGPWFPATELAAVSVPVPSAAQEEKT